MTPLRRWHILPNDANNNINPFVRHFTSPLHITTFQFKIKTNKMPVIVANSETSHPSEQYLFCFVFSSTLSWQSLFLTAEFWSRTVNTVALGRDATSVINTASMWASVMREVQKIRPFNVAWDLYILKKESLHTLISCFSDIMTHWHCGYFDRKGSSQLPKPTVWTPQLSLCCMILQLPSGQSMSTIKTDCSRSTVLMT